MSPSLKRARTIADLERVLEERATTSKPRRRAKLPPHAMRCADGRTLMCTICRHVYHEGACRRLRPLEGRRRFAIYFAAGGRVHEREVVAQHAESRVMLLASPVPSAWLRRDTPFADLAAPATGSTDAVWPDHAWPTAHEAEVAAGLRRFGASWMGARSSDEPAMLPAEHAQGAKCIGRPWPREVRR